MIIMTEENNDNQNQPSDRELREEWQRRRAQEAQRNTSADQDQDISQLKSPSANVRPTDPKTGAPMSYEDMRNAFDRAIGVSKGWEVADTSDHDISQIPKPSDGRLKNDSGQYISYEDARRIWFEKQGRKDPSVAKKLMDSKNQQRRSQYE